MFPPIFAISVAILTRSLFKPRGRPLFPETEPQPPSPRKTLCGSSGPILGRQLPDAGPTVAPRNIAQSVELRVPTLVGCMTSKWGLGCAGSCLLARLGGD